ncbi:MULTISPECIES: alanine racemase [Caulobacter]|uniref:Alanine racemase n=1 Tax=Caulobacter vibrioides OR37 TaxID=1292034 RepID=R0D581_CAUVI|nr:MULTISPECIES: alanine racemase [Caulobacter]ENZ83555.1 alanine racemase [Caulobacter vibrioides OR37]MBQ1561414.1 alanine racemase [Caulobacter sp.]
MTDLHDARLTIDLDAVAANFAALKARAGDQELAPAVKADAYGLGAARVADRLWAEGARSFYVARLAEGVALRAALGDRAAAIYVLDGATPGAGDALEGADLIPVLNSLPQIEAWNAQARSGRLKAALHLDTGMNRLGLRPEELKVLLGATDRLKRLDLDLVISHLACADVPDHPMNARQRERFAEAVALLPDARKSFANSAGLFLGEAYRFDQARPGISLYGGGPEGRPHPEIRAVATVEAPILQVRVVPRGETVGYGATWTAPETTRIAIVGAGYADGVPRASPPNGEVWFDGARRPMRGRISMDLMAIDVTDCDAARPGAMVELLGPNLPVDDAAAAANATAYELLTHIAPRARRIYR